MIFHGPGSIAQPQFSSLSSIFEGTDSISSVLIASPLCTILQHRALDALEELKEHIIKGVPSGLPLIYRTSYEGLVLYYMVMDKTHEQTTKFCASVLASPTEVIQKRVKEIKHVADNKLNDNDQVKPLIFLCVGVTGAAYIHASNPWLFALPDRLHESTRMLNHWSKAVQRNKQEGKKWVRALLASLIADEEDVKTNDEFYTEHTLSAADEARIMSEKDQILTLFDENMVPVDDFVISLPSLDSPRYSSRKSHQNPESEIDLQYGFDAPDFDNLGSSPKNGHNVLKSATIPTPFKTPHITRWRDTESSHVPQQPKRLFLDSLHANQTTTSSSEKDRKTRGCFH